MQLCVLTDANYIVMIILQYIEISNYYFVQLETNIMLHLTVYFNFEKRKMAKAVGQAFIPDTGDILRPGGRRFPPARAGTG